VAAELIRDVGFALPLRVPGSSIVLGYWQEAQMRAVNQLKRLCDERQVPVAQVALGLGASSTGHYLSHRGREQSRAP
jgi:hypothetical protein